MRRFLAACCFCLLAPVELTKAQVWLPDTLSKAAKVSLLSTGPSMKNLYAAFGHSGVRVQDPVQGLDLLFNFGVFNFDRPDFYLNYMRGYLIYSMGLFDGWGYIIHTEEEGRSLHSQRLALNAQQRLSLYRKLKDTYDSEERYFQYDYLYNNCATKIRDLLEEQLPGLEFGNQYAEEDENTHSFRSLINTGMRNFPWFRLSIDIMFGSELDKVLSARDYMFLPQYVYAGAAQAQLPRGDSTVALVAEEHLLLPDQQASRVPLNGPMWLFWGILLGVFWISYRDSKRKCHTGWVDAGLLGMCGIAGMVMLFLWVGTNHHSSWNYNLLWAWPTHLVAALGMYSPWKKYFFLPYMKIYAVIIAGLLLSWGFLPQQMPKELLPLWISLLLRGVQYMQLHKQRKRETEQRLVKHSSSSAA